MADREAKKTREATLARFLRDYSQAEKPHTDRVAAYKRCDEIYEGILRPADPGREWESDLHPPYALQIVETLEAGLDEDEPTATVEALLPGEDLEKGAEAHEKLLDYQREQYGWAQKTGKYAKQGLIRGLTVGKVPWVYERQEYTERTWERDMMGTWTEGDPKTAYDVATYPGFEVVDVNDFLWDPAATSLDDAAFVFHRTYQTMATLRALEAAGVYENIADVTAASQKLSESPGGRELFDRVEVIEYWRRGRLVTVANRATVIRDEPNPYTCRGHDGIPFVAGSTMPHLFALGGRSEVEIIADIQAGIWDLMNQATDNAKFMANITMLLQEGENDIEAVFPGARIFLKNPANAQFLNPPTGVISPIMQLIESFKGDLQTISPANAYMSGADSTQIDQKTATGISLIQNMGQRRLLRKKRELGYGLQRAGQQQIALNQHLLESTQAIPPAAANGLNDWMFVEPRQLQGKYLYKVEDVSESLNRQEKRAEALAKATFFLGNYAIFAQAGVMIDLRTVVEDVSEAFDEDPEKYIAPVDPMAAAMQAGMGAAPMPGGPPPPGAMPAGGPPLSLAPPLGGQPPRPPLAPVPA